MKIGIFGCTADPFTPAHYEIVKKVIADKLVDRVIVLPTIVDYYRKDKTVLFDLASKETIIKKWLENCWYITPDFYEYKLAVNTRQYYDDPKEINNRRYWHSLQDCIKRYGEDNEYYTIIGADSWNNITSWFNFRELGKATKFIVVCRSGQPINFYINYPEYHQQPYKVIELEKKFENMSASNIRNWLIDTCNKKWNEINKNDFTCKADYMMKLWLDFAAEYKHTGNFADNMFDNIDNNTDKKDLLIAHTPIFDLVKGPMIEEGFKPVKIKSPDWVSIIIEKDGKYLMTKQLRHGLNKEFEEFPCGMVEAGEDIIEAGLRELQEETGYVVCDNRCVHYLGKFAANPAFMTNYMHYLHVNLDYTLYDKCPTSFDEHEHLTSYWVNKKTAFDNFIKSEGSAIMGCAWMILMKKKYI